MIGRWWSVALAARLLVACAADPSAEVPKSEQAPAGAGRWDDAAYNDVAYNEVREGLAQHNPFKGNKRPKALPTIDCEDVTIESVRGRPALIRFKLLEGGDHYCGMVIGYTDNTELFPVVQKVLRQQPGHEHSTVTGLMGFAVRDVELWTPGVPEDADDERRYVGAFPVPGAPLHRSPTMQLEQVGFSYRNAGMDNDEYGGFDFRCNDREGRVAPECLRFKVSPYGE